MMTDTFSIGQTPSSLERYLVYTASCSPQKCYSLVYGTLLYCMPFTMKVIHSQDQSGFWPTVYIHVQYNYLLTYLLTDSVTVMLTKLTVKFMVCFEAFSTKF